MADYFLIGIIVGIGLSCLARLIYKTYAEYFNEIIQKQLEEDRKKTIKTHFE